MPKNKLTPCIHDPEKPCLHRECEGVFLHNDCEGMKELVKAREKFLARFNEAVQSHRENCFHAKKKQR